jgi:hypothetical protein
MWKKKAEKEIGIAVLNKNYALPFAKNSTSKV